MNELTIGAKLNTKELSDWFGIKSTTFLHHKEQKLNELADFCKFEIKETKTGRFSSVYIIEVYEATYIRNPLKKEFLTWIENGGIEKVAAQTPDGVYSYPVVVNYYCATHGIPYDGPHYENVLQNGIGDDGYRLKDGKRKTPNEEFHEWHYLYRLLRKYQMEQGINVGYKIKCCATSFNPTSLRKETEADRELQNKIYQKYFGKISYQDLCDLMDTVSDMVERGEITAQDKDEVIDNKIMRTLSDKAKRRRAALECARAGVLRREGRQYGEEHFVEETKIEIKEGDFDF